MNILSFDQRYIENYTKMTYIKSMVNTFPIILYEQLVWLLLRKFNSNNIDKVESDIALAQELNICFIYDKHWVVSVNMYQTITGDRFYDGINRSKQSYIQDSKFEKKLKSSGFFKPNIIASIWIACQFNQVYKYIINEQSIWDISIIIIPNKKNRNAQLVQIVSMSDELDNTLCYCLRNEKNNCDKNLTRIVNLENKNHSYKVPMVGINFITNYDPNDDYKYLMLKKIPEKDCWKDAE